MQLQVKNIVAVIDQLKSEGMSKKDIMDLPVYIGDDDELNGIHTAWYCQKLNSDREEDLSLIEIIKESRHNVEFKNNAILIS